MGNKQSAELTEEPKPRKPREKKHKKKRGSKKGEGGKKKGEQELKLIEHVEDKQDGECDEKGMEVDIPFDHYSFPFENVVLEGGGNRNMAHCGAVRVSDTRTICCVRFFLYLFRSLVIIPFL